MTQVSTVYVAISISLARLGSITCRAAPGGVVWYVSVPLSHGTSVPDIEKVIPCSKLHRYPLVSCYAVKIGFMLRSFHQVFQLSRALDHWDLVPTLNVFNNFHENRKCSYHKIPSIEDVTKTFEQFNSTKYCYILRFKKRVHLERVYGAGRSTFGRVRQGGLDRRHTFCTTQSVDPYIIHVSGTNHSSPMHDKISIFDPWCYTERLWTDSDFTLKQYIIPLHNIMICAPKDEELDNEWW